MLKIYREMHKDWGTDAPFFTFSKQRERYFSRSNLKFWFFRRDDSAWMRFCMYWGSILLESWASSQRNLRPKYSYFVVGWPLGFFDPKTFVKKENIEKLVAMIWWQVLILLGKVLIIYYKYLFGDKRDWLFIFDIKK